MLQVSAERPPLLQLPSTTWMQDLRRAIASHPRPQRSVAVFLLATVPAESAEGLESGRSGVTPLVEASGQTPLVDEQSCSWV